MRMCVKTDLDMRKCSPQKSTLLIQELAEHFVGLKRQTSIINRLLA